MTRITEDEVSEALSYANGGPAISRKLVGRIMERVSELLTDNADLLEENIILRMEIQILREAAGGIHE